ncbi:MAG: thiosulfate oxidation carrier complex protein SoxZ [Puniceicoccaceae bacterium]|nr:MAG: thiosulfate oxidation carrier complex protein SoxZ [Puniceicoccaceae bacterium]
MTYLPMKKAVASVRAWAGRRGALALAALLMAAPASAARSPESWDRIAPARELLGDAKPRAGGIELRLPAVTQDGSSVPLTVRVDHPMEEGNFVEALYLFASGNPSPELAEIRFTPLAGEARIDTRIRLDGSQTVVALARTSRGEWLAGAREVRVTVSGCNSRSAGSVENLMEVRVRAPDRLRAGQTGDVRTLINHPMETGLRADAEGRVIPERIVRTFRVEFEGRTVLEARYYRAMAANPYLLFPVAPERSGTLSFFWKEDAGESVTAEASIRVS